MKIDLTKGSITKNILLFSIPMILGNLLQQLYNVADTFIVGKYLGANAIAAVGSSFTLMVFLTSIILGLCMGSGAVFAICYGAGQQKRLKNSIIISFIMIALITIIVNIVVLVYIDPILQLLQVPDEILADMKAYLQIIFYGIGFTFLYNFFSALLRAVGDSVSPLIFLAVSALVNIVLDIYFIYGLNYGVAGAAIATVIAQGLSAAGITIYAGLKLDVLRLKREDFYWQWQSVKEIFQSSILTCMQQSVMNFGILMIQGLVNSFGTAVMAAFAVAVKVDSFAYLPLQDFGNAFSVFTAQNFGAGQTERLKKGVKRALCLTGGFSLLISVLVVAFARPLMRLFIDANETEIIRLGIEYLRIEGTFYIGIGVLFLFYGYFRAIKRPGMSLVLTIISLGTRVVLAYLLAPIPAIGVLGIWWAIPIGWFLADATGIICLLRQQKKSNVFLAE